MGANISPTHRYRRTKLHLPRSRFLPRHPNRRAFTRYRLPQAQKTKQRYRSPRISRSSYVSRRGSSPLWALPLRLERKCKNPLDCAKYRGVHICSWSTDWLSVYADLCCGCVYAVCGECGGGGDGFEVTGGVWVSAFCAIYVGEVGVWVGWDIAWFACYCTGYSGTVFDVEVWAEVEEYEPVCCRVVLNKPLFEEDNHHWPCRYVLREDF